LVNVPTFSAANARDSCLRGLHIPSPLQSHGRLPLVQALRSYKSHEIIGFRVPFQFEVFAFLCTNCQSLFISFFLPNVLIEPLWRKLLTYQLAEKERLRGINKDGASSIPAPSPFNPDSLPRFAPSNFPPINHVIYMLTLLDERRYAGPTRCTFPSTGRFPKECRNARRGSGLGTCHRTCRGGSEDFEGKRRAGEDGRQGG
jgi:hypothetical protein